MTRSTVWTIVARMSAVGIALLVAAQVVAQADDALDDSFFADNEQTVAQDATRVLQNRKYNHGQEVSLLFGTIPADPFYKGVTATLGYTFHLTENWAWEVAQFTYSYNVDTSLKKEVLLFRPAELTDFPEINYIVASHLVFKPLYGRQAVFNTDLVHLEGFAQIGPAVVLRDDKPNTPRWGFDFGIGVRVWLGRHVSFRLDLNELFYWADGVQPTFHVHGGFGFNLIGDD